MQGATTTALVINPYTAADAGNDYNMQVTGLCSPQAITTSAALTTCSTTGIAGLEDANATLLLSVYPNPFTHTLNLSLNAPLQIGDYQFRLYNVLGELLLQLAVTNQLTVIETGKLPAGIYLYRIINHDHVLQSGRLVSQ